MQKTTKSLEKVMVVKTLTLFPDGVWEGIRSEGVGAVQRIIKENRQFLTRAKVEDDPSYKQIIPYLIFCFKDRIFLMRRGTVGKEKRLHNKYTVGIGGHIRSSDLTHDDIFQWAKREFEEEVNYQGNFKVEVLGLLNREKTPVDSVHFGFVLRLIGDSDKIAVKNEHASGKLATLSECFGFYDQMEGWSQEVLDFLKGEKNG